MRVIAVDDEPISLEILKLQLDSIPEFEEVETFSNPGEALDWIRENSADIAFLDIIMNDMTGIELAGAIRTVRPTCHIVFTTSSKDYAMEAFRVHASGYLVKPVTRDAIVAELQHILNMYSAARDGVADEPEKKALRVQCFGNFEAFDRDNTPIHFKYSKAKELLAYLVHRTGASCTVRELAAVLYEDREDSESLQSQIRNLISDLNRSLAAVGAEEVIYKKRGSIAVLPDRIDCDYYEFSKGDGRAIEAYKGEYMTQYDWAEDTTAYLNNRWR